MVRLMDELRALNELAYVRARMPALRAWCADLAHYARVLCCFIYPLPPAMLWDDAAVSARELCDRQIVSWGYCAMGILSLLWRHHV